MPVLFSLCVCVLRSLLVAVMMMKARASGENMRHCGFMSRRKGLFIGCGALRHAAAAASSGSAHDALLTKGPQKEIDSLVKEINHLWTQRGRGGERRLRVLASKLRAAPKAVVAVPPPPSPPPLPVEKACKKEDFPRPSSSYLATSGDSPIASIVQMQYRSNLSDIACTLEELEGALYQLSGNGPSTLDSQEADVHLLGEEMKMKEIINTGTGDGNTEKVAIMSDSSGNSRQAAEDSAAEERVSDTPSTDDSKDCEIPTYWFDAADIEPIDTGTLLEVSSSQDRSFTLKLMERPRSVRTIITVLGKALTEVESLMGSSSNFSVVFCSASGVPFFTPLNSELEFACSSRIELFMEKERLFQRIKGASAQGVSFTAELGGYALDFGAELLFMCDGVMVQGSCASNVKIGFPSIKDGVWPSPCVVQRIAHALGSTRCAMVVAPSLHRITWDDVQLKFPELLRIKRDSLYVQKMNKNALLSNVQLWQKKMRDFFGCGAEILHADEKTGDVLWGQWGDYCALVGSFDVEDAATVAFKALDMYAALLGTSESRNTVEVTRSLRRMYRRELTTAPHEGYVEVGASVADGAEEDAPFWIFRDGSSPATVRYIATQRICSGDNKNRSALLFGQLEAVKEAVELLDCAVVATPLCPPKFSDSGVGEMMEVHLLRAPLVSKEEGKKTLSSALAYLQSKEIPYILTRGGDIGVRLVAALALELCRLATETEVQLVEQVTRESLGFCVRPFQLLDHYGTRDLFLVMQRHQHITKNRDVTSVAQMLLSAMDTEGLCGDRSCHGGFYRKNGQLNPSAVRMTEKRSITQNDILVRILAALVNESCRMLLEGSVDRVEDINLVSISALTMSLSTGGLLSCVDTRIGFSTLLQNMEYMSRSIGATAKPSPLLLTMRASGETFRTLSKDSLQQARRTL